MGLEPRQQIQALTLKPFFWGGNLEVTSVHYGRSTIPRGLSQALVVFPKLLTEQPERAVSCPLDSYSILPRYYLTIIRYMCSVARS